MEKVTAEEAKVLLRIWKEHLKSILNSIQLSFLSLMGYSKAEMEKGKVKDLAPGGVFSLL